MRFILGFVFRLHGVDFLLLFGNDADLKHLSNKPA